MKALPTEYLFGRNFYPNGRSETVTVVRRKNPALAENLSFVHRQPRGGKSQRRTIDMRRKIISETLLDCFERVAMPPE